MLHAATSRVPSQKGSDLRCEPQQKQRAATSTFNTSNTDSICNKHNCSIKDNPSSSFFSYLNSPFCLTYEMLFPLIIFRI